VLSPGALIILDKTRVVLTLSFLLARTFFFLLPFLFLAIFHTTLLPSEATALAARGFKGYATRNAFIKKEVRKKSKVGKKKEKKGSRKSRLTFS